MTPYTFHTGDARKVKVDNSSQFRTLRFYGKNIYPSLLLSQMLDLYVGSHVAVTLDEDSPMDIYIRKADDKDDNRNTQTATVCADSVRKGTLVFSSKAVVDYVLNLLGNPTSAVLYVSPTPTFIGKKKYYKILINQIKKIVWQKDTTHNSI